MLLILLAVGGISYWRFLGVAGSLNNYVQRVSVMTASRDIDRNFAELRRHVREFALTGNTDEGVAASSSTEAVKSAIDHGIAITTHAYRHGRMQDIATQFEEYRKGTEAVFPAKREQDKLVSDTLDPAGTAARADFDTLIADMTRGGNAELSLQARDGEQALMLLRLSADKVIDRRHDDVAAKKCKRLKPN